MTLAVSKDVALAVLGCMHHFRDLDVTSKPGNVMMVLHVDVNYE
jgi:hypothetical protein